MSIATLCLHTPGIDQDLPGISTRTYSGFACVEDEGGTKWVKEQADHGETTYYYRYSRVVEWMHSPLGFGAFRMPIRRLGEMPVVRLATQVECFANCIRGGVCNVTAGGNKDIFASQLSF